MRFAMGLGPRLLGHRRGHFAAHRRHALVQLLVVACRERLAGGLLALFDQLADLVAALLADLLVEGSAALGLDRVAALLADLLVEAGAALGLDRVAALLADLLVEAAAALRLDGLTALAADLLVEGVPVLVADRLPALAASFAHRHRTLLLSFL